MEKNKTVDYSKCSERKICRLIGGGDEGAFSYIYHKYNREVLSFVIQKALKPEVSEEICNIAWVKVWKKIGDFQFKSTVKTWIHRIALNTLWDYQKREKKYILANDYSPENAGPNLEHIFSAGSLFNQSVCADYKIVEQPLVYEEMNLKESLIYLNKSIKKLSKEHKETLEMYIFQEMEYKEIAKKKNIPIGTVMSRIFYARQFLKKELSKRLYDAIHDCIPTKRLCLESKSP